MWFQRSVMLMGYPGSSLRLYEPKIVKPSIRNSPDCVEANSNKTLIRCTLKLPEHRYSDETDEFDACSVLDCTYHYSSSRLSVSAILCPSSIIPFASNSIWLIEATKARQISSHIRIHHEFGTKATETGGGSTSRR